MSLTAQAGMRLGVIQEKLRRVGQGFFLPLDPPCAEEATLGGAVAANASGAGRLAYGTLRDLVLGVEVVVPDEAAQAARAAAGGKTVKNVSGYDMSKLYIGSLGTLGIVVAVTCKIMPLPEDRATVLAGFPGEDASLACAQAVRESQLFPSCFDIYDPETAGSFVEAVRPSSEHLSWLAVRLEGISEAVAYQTAEIETLARSQGSTDVVILRGSGEADHWKQMGRLAVALRSEKPLSVGLKVSVPPGLDSKVSTFIGDQGARMNLPLRRLSRAGSGIVYAHMPLSAERYAEKEGALVRTAKVLRKHAEDMGGALIVEYAPPAFKKKVDVWGEAGGVFSIMKGLKQAFDPKGILNPGRFVGGI
jgi:glycolate oxidase FAD binding subunit